MMKKGYILFILVISLFLLFIINQLFFTNHGDEAPVIYGVRNVHINKGESFNPLQKVKAKDEEDGNITDQVIVTGHYNINKKGSYSINYSVTDSAGNSTQTTIKLYVGKQESEGNFIFFIILLFAVAIYLILKNSHIKVKKFRFIR